MSTGNITVEEFGRVMKQSGQNPSEEELAQIIKEVDLDGDGTINFDGMPHSVILFYSRRYSLNSSRIYLHDDRSNKTKAR